MTWDRFPSLVGLRLRAFGAQPPSEQTSAGLVNVFSAALTKADRRKLTRIDFILCIVSKTAFWLPESWLGTDPTLSIFFLPNFFFKVLPHKVPQKYFAKILRRFHRPPPPIRQGLKGLTQLRKKVVEYLYPKYMSKMFGRFPLITFATFYSKTFGNVEDIDVWNFRPKWFLWRHF